MEKITQHRSTTQKIKNLFNNSPFETWEQLVQDAKNEVMTELNISNMTSDFQDKFNFDKNEKCDDQQLFESSSLNFDNRV